MAYELIISEKPKQAYKIAYALSDSKPQVKRYGSVSYYETSFKGKKIIVAAAVGHLFGLKEKESKQWEYPVFDINWTPIFDVNPKAMFAKGYFNALTKLAGEATEFTVSCDYDAEGELIGYNILRFICKAKDGARMKFSTLTVPDLQEAYKQKSPSINLNQALAGETRHILDWYYGVNVSRALTKAIHSSGTFKVLSSGRVQGPALKILVDREREILTFVAKPYWELKYKGNLKKGELEGQHAEGKFWEKKKASAIFKKCNGKDGKVESCEDSDYSQLPPPPFDLTSLQIEAYRAFGINPQETLNNAQVLYLGGFISYPRTSSQKLPYQLGFAKILKALSANENYKELCNELLSKDKLRPRQGKGDDPAHPAIYPTGNNPKKLTKGSEQIYDLIARRFMACFADPAERLTRKILFKVAEEDFLAEGITTVKPGWHVFYKPYLHLNEKELPKTKKGDNVKFKSLDMNEDVTKPAKRYSQASLVKELSDRNLGTKGTRAQIVDTLFKRGYLLGREIKPTELGMQVISVLEKQVPKIIDEELTRSFEEDFEKIREGKLSENTVVAKAKKVLSQILAEFKEKEESIGEDLKSANESANEANSIGQCPVCKKGNLIIKFSKQRKRFLACDRYPECSTTFPIPQAGRVYKTEKPCKDCGYPTVKVYSPEHKRTTTLCINKDCSTNKSEKENKPCPKCKEGKLVVRTSRFGKFMACDKYPNCKHTEKLK